MIVGKIYFVEGPGRIKIGYTRQPDKRLASLRASDMEDLKSLGVIPGTRALEKTLHNRASAYRIRGEWFVDCEAVRSLVSDALNGKYQIEEGENCPSPRTGGEIPIGAIALSAVHESARLAREIERRVAARESISDLVDSACFLGEHVIARMISGA